MCSRGPPVEPWARRHLEIYEELIESLLALDYPRDRLQILIVSDASVDRTDEIVRSYADQDIGLLRLDERGGSS